MVKALRNILSQPVLRTIYFAKFQSKLGYGIILWGAENSSKKVFIMQKNMFQTIKGVNNRVSCRKIFKDYKILTLTSL
jgi:S-ribosylhomocysteine lyase LuxS involved in autoinducer biosynthesis